MQQEIEEAVIERIRTRRDVGRAKYGTTMERTDLTQLDWLRHAQEEALDLAIYLERIIRDEENEHHSKTCHEEPKSIKCTEHYSKEESQNPPQQQSLNR